MLKGLIILLVFSKCFRAGFWAVSELKDTVEGVTNSCNLWVIIKLSTNLIFICVACGPFCVSLLTARL